MRRVLFALALLCASSALALVAPEEYSIDPTCPQNAPFSSINRRCVSCDTPRALMLEDPKDCAVCRNRTVDNVDSFGGWITSHYCRLKKCPKDKPFYEEKWNSSGCKSCEDEPTFITKEQCDKCQNMRWVKDANYCAPNLQDRVYHQNGNVKIWRNGEVMYSVPMDGGMAPWSTSCTDLTPSYGMAVSPNECARCQNTYMKDGFCFGRLDCANEPKWVTKEDCTKCPNMRWVDNTAFKMPSYCAPDLPDSIYFAGEGWIKCSNIYPDLHGLLINAEECARCPNTYMKDGFCFGKK